MEKTKLTTLIENIKTVLLCLILVTVITGAVIVTSAFLLTVATTSGNTGSDNTTTSVNMEIMNRYDQYMTNQVSNALDGVLAIEKVYWLSDDDMVAPEPNQDLFGSTSDPSTLGWLLEDAQKLLDGQETVFKLDMPIGPNTEVQYYLDDTILAITWKQPMGNTMYTISEVKIAHPSQLRRFLSGGAYGSPIQLTTSEMATSVNAVVASSGDFYAFRRHGVIVYNGEVKRCDPNHVDTCYFDDKGDIIFTRRRELPTMEAAQAFVDQNNIRFSVAFGPILVDNGEEQKVPDYLLGEIYDRYCRAAICQMGPLHYLVMVAATEGRYVTTPHLFEFQDHIMTFKPEKAYTLDGGQTGVIVMNDKVINKLYYGSQRDISDIIYFATAIPDGE